MQTENFDLDKVKTLSPLDAKQYVDKYFVPLTYGNHALCVNGKYEVYDDAVVKKTYFKRMSSEVNKYYFLEKTYLRTITYDIFKPQFKPNMVRGNRNDSALYLKCPQGAGKATLLEFIRK